MLSNHDVALVFIVCISLCPHHEHAACIACPRELPALAVLLLAMRGLSVDPTMTTQHTGRAVCPTHTATDLIMDMMAAAEVCRNLCWNTSSIS